MQEASKFGIYLNSKENKVVRINSPYWIPEEPAWVFLTPEVNATLLQIREIAKEQGHSSQSEVHNLGYHPFSGISLLLQTPAIPPPALKLQPVPGNLKTTSANGGKRFVVRG